MFVKSFLRHYTSRADLPVGPDARQRVPATVQGFKARNFSGNSLPRSERGRGWRPAK
jgi:hypothetical protein